MKNQETMTDHVAIIINKNYAKQRKMCCGISCKTILNVLAHLILPFSLGIFTVVVALYQQKVATDQRREDRILAREQREQDLNISSLQRELDKQIAQQQREEDELRRYQDLNISALQRDLDLQIAENKKIADDLNAARQRNLSTEQRHHELEVERTKFLDTLLLAYINEIGILLEKGNGSLTHSSTVVATARAKTLSVISQLDPIRSVALIRFLQNADQLTVNESPLDLSGALLNEIDLSKSLQFPMMKSLSLVRTFLINASFANQDISNWNFNSANLIGADFTRSNCTGTIFYGANLIRANFSYSILSNTSFEHADLTSAIFTGASGLKKVQYAKFQYVNFTDDDFMSGTFTDPIQFIDCSLFGSVFRRTILQYINFEYCNLTNTTFDVTELRRVSFVGSTLAYAHLTNIYLNAVTFSFVNFSYANLSDVRYCSGMGCQDPFLTYIFLWNAILPGNMRGSANPNPLPDGQAQKCTVSNGTGVWKIQTDPIINRAHIFEEQKCAFTPAQYLGTEIMSQVVKITKLFSQYSVRLVVEGRARLVVRSSAGWHTGIYVNEYSNDVFVISHTHQYINESNSGSMTASEYRIIESNVLLQKNTTSLNVTVVFTAKRSQTYMWMEYIELDMWPRIYAPN